VVDSIDTDTLKFLAESTHNAAFIEEYRRRNCVRRYWDIGDDSCGVYAPLLAEPCDCWACERYGLDAYWDFHLHPDGYYPDQYLADGKCHCWVCSMAR
jgi:hypothetical protein